MPAADTTPLTTLTGPGAAFDLGVAELCLKPELARVDRVLDVVGTNDTVTATYFVGSNGIVSTPGEPVRPLETINVSRPSAGWARGVGFRGGKYEDLPHVLPFTGAPATEVRGVHGQFLSEVFYPIRPWTLNQIGELCDIGGASLLNVFPAQYVSDSPTSLTGTMRTFSEMCFAVFYSPTLSEAALAIPPAINIVSSDEDGTISVDVATSTSFDGQGNLTSVGVQEVWVTYTGLPGSSAYGRWESVTLAAPATAFGIGTWTGQLPLPAGTHPNQIRYMVQAVSGVGTVAQSTNFGRFFALGASTLDGVGVVIDPTTLTLISPPVVGFYRQNISVQARLTDADNGPLAGKRVLFRLGSIVASALTDSTGLAETSLLLNTRPGMYELVASFAGDANYQSSTADAGFAVEKRPTQLTFEAGGLISDISKVVVRLEADDGTPLKERTVLFVLRSGSDTFAMAEITDGAGRARVTRPGIAAGTYDVQVYFGMTVTLPDGETVVVLDDPLYGSSQTGGSVTLSTSVSFDREQAYLYYEDLMSPATSADPGLSQVQIAGRFAGPNDQFSPFFVLGDPPAPVVNARVSAQLSGRTIVEGTLELRVQSSGSTQWRGDATIDGRQVQLHVNWDSFGGTGSYQVWITVPPGSGPLYHDLPAILDFDLLLGVGSMEQPIGGSTIFGGAEKPWTSEVLGARSYLRN
jgi:hypothetical protein